MKQYFIIFLYDWSRRILKPLLAPAHWEHNDVFSRIQRLPLSSGRVGKEAALEFFLLSLVKRF